VSGSLRADFGILRRRRFATLFAARTISVLGDAFAPVAIAFGVLALPGADAVTLGSVLAGYSVARVGLMLFGGVIADRLPRFRVLVVADLVAGAGYAGIAVLLLSGSSFLPALVGFSALAGAAAALFLPAFSGVVPEVVRPDERQAANGLLRLSTNIARISGFALAGAMVALIGGGWALLVNAASFAVSAALMASLRLPATVRATGANVLADLRTGWREFASRQWLWVIVGTVAFTNAAMNVTYGLLGPIVARDGLGGSVAWSAVLAANALGLMLGVFVALRIRPRHPMFVCALTLFPLAPTPLLLGLGAPLPYVVLATFLSGIAVDVFGVLWETTFQREVPGEALSRVSSYEWVGSLALGPVALLVAAPLAERYGARPVLVGAAALVVVVSTAALTSVQVRELRAPPEVATA